MITLQSNATDIRELFAAAQERCKSLAPAMRVVAVRLQRDAMDNFRAGGRFPSVWPKSRKTSGLTLINRAMLRNSIHGASGADFAQVGSDLIYARIHQLGGVIRPKGPRTQTYTTKQGKTIKRTVNVLTFKIGGRWISKREVTIPARPFLPVDAAGNLRPDTTQFIVDTMHRHILGS